MIHSEDASQSSRKQDEMKTHLRTQNVHAINSTIAENVIATLQSSLGVLENLLKTKMDLQFNGLEPRSRNNSPNVGTPIQKGFHSK